MKRDVFYVKWFNYSVIVRRFDDVNEKKMFVGFLYRFLFVIMVYKIKRFFMIVVVIIKM